MNISTVKTDNIIEVLEKIVDFTETRHRLLTANISNANESDFVPRDLDAEGFADVMAQAVSEHMQNRRLLFCDSETVKFGERGSFEVTPVIDKQGQSILEEGVEKYVQLQIDRLSENVINKRIAAELLVWQQSNREQMV